MHVKYASRQSLYPVPNVSDGAGVSVNARVVLRLFVVTVGVAMRAVIVLRDGDAVRAMLTVRAFVAVRADVVLRMRPVSVRGVMDDR